MFKDGDGDPMAVKDVTSTHADRKSLLVFRRPRIEPVNTDSTSKKDLVDVGAGNIPDPRHVAIGTQGKLERPEV